MAEACMMVSVAHDLVATMYQYMKVFEGVLYEVCEHRSYIELLTGLRLGVGRDNNRSVLWIILGKLLL